MADIQFYYLNAPLEHVLPKLLEKSLQGGFKALVKVESEEKAEQLSAMLWTQNPDSFLPHGTKKDGNAVRQPVYLTAADENPNGANLIVVTDGSEVDADDTIRRVLDIVDGRDAVAIDQAGKRRKKYEAEGHVVAGVRQTPAGGWEKQVA